MSEPRHVLVVEDDDDIRESLVLVLEDEGFEAHPAANGREALDLIAHGEKPDLILLDLMMPVLNGWEFMTELKRDTRFSDTPIVIVSAVGEKVPRPEGAVAFLEKPVPLADLLKIVRQHVRS